VAEAADVVVIGAGAAGAAATWRLARAGIAVVCLEQGDWVAPESLRSADPAWERHRLQDWNPNPNVRKLPADYPIDDSASPLRPLLFNGVGGSTIMWSAFNPRFRPSDFRVRSTDGVADDWPLGYDELAPYYDLGDSVQGVSGLTGDPAYPRRRTAPLPPLPIGPAGWRLADAFERLGWHWWLADRANRSVAGPNGEGVCNGCGVCEMGCPQRAKGSVDVTFWPAAIAAGARLITGARVREIVVDDRGHASGVLWIDRDRRTHLQAARAVIVAANGIGTPRLLLASRSNRFPDGLGNSEGVVGRNLMFHPIAYVSGVFAEPIHGHLGPSPSVVYSQQFYASDPKRGFVRGYMLSGMRGHGPLAMALGAWAEVAPWGREHHRRFARVLGRTGSIAVLGEDLPDPRNQVTLSATLVDADGIPAPELHYVLDDNSRRLLDHGIANAGEALREAGATETVVMPLLRDAGFHLMGTARMGSDPKRSVVDRWGRCHDVPNLFVCDGSVFVTSAAVNPTPTILALALRTADHIIATRGAIRARP
jgi:choline dehydrogenase-like flavoprotein